MQPNCFTFTKWIPLNRKASRYSHLLQTCKAGQVLKLRKKPYVYVMDQLIEQRIPFLVSLSYEALISYFKMRGVLKLCCTSLYS